jgi:hypothetical protein
MIPENLSSESVGKRYFKRWVQPFDAYWTQRIKEAGKYSFEACGTPEGGIIACGEVGPDVPLENIVAMYEAFREYGKY